MPKTRNTKLIISIIGFAFLAEIFAVRLVNFIVSRLIPNLSSLAAGNPWIAVLDHQGPIYLIGLPIFLLTLSFIKNGTDLRPKEKMKAGKIFLLYLGASGLGFMINMVFIFIISTLSAIGAPVGISATTEGLNLTGIQGLFAGLLIACIAGFGEEFVYRYVLYKKMAGCPDILYILVSGITFGIIHSHFAMGIGHIFVGMMFAYIYLKTRSYLTIALLHTLTDSIGFFFKPLADMLAPGSSEFISPVHMALMIGAFILLLILFIMKKDRRLGLLPASESGWEFVKSPLGAVLINPGMGLFTLWCLGNMVYNLFPK